MNTLDIIIIVIVAISVLNGLIKGFIKTLFGLTSLIAAVILTWMFTPIVSELVMNETAFDEMISEKVVELLNLEEMVSVDLDTTDAVQTMNDLTLPENLVESLIENYTPKIIESLDVSGIGEYIGDSLAVMAVKSLVFVLLFAVISIIINTVATLLDLVARLPVLKQINRIGGLGLGLIIGVVTVWIGALILSFIISIQSTEALSQLIESSVLAKLFYYNNPLQNYVMNLQSGLQ